VQPRFICGRNHNGGHRIIGRGFRSRVNGASLNVMVIDDSARFLSL
jgi:hypothetical protein